MLETVFSNLCRCCMKSGKFNIFSTLFESQTIAQILGQMLSEKISFEDKLPKTICHHCFNKIISQFLFIKNYHKVQELLHQILQREGTEKEQEKTRFSDIENINISYLYDSDDDQPLSLLCNKEDNYKKSISVKTSVDNLRAIQSNEIEFKNNIQNLNLLNHELDEIILQNKDSYESHCSTECLIEKEIQNVPHKHSNNFNPDSLNCHQHSGKNDGTEQVYEKHSQSTSEKIENLKHSCSDCIQSFEFIKQLRTHCKDTGHVFPRRFTCEVCSKKFLSKTRLNDHMRIHNNERPFACNECDMTFTLSPNLKRHKKKHTGEKSYFCEVCGKGFIQKHALTIHMRLHNGETPYVCDLCGKGFRSKPFLQQHLDKHNGTETQAIKYQKNYLKYGKIKVECKICQKIITKSGLYNHMKIQHGDGLKKFLCNLCGKTYASKTSLDVHMNIHTKKNSYDCNICSKSFTHKNYLKSHLMLHSGERPHCCDLCGKTFVQRTHLDRHMRTHTGARPYSCTYCDKAFALNENLKVHIRIHTNETPHVCTVCGKGFFNSSSKKKHETSAHQIPQK